MNILMLLEMAASGMPDRVGLGARDSGLTYPELLERARAAASLMSDSDAERVLVCDRTSEALPIALFGAAAAGRAYVPLNYRLSDPELRALAERTAPALALVDEAGATRIGDIDGLHVVERSDFLESVATGSPPVADGEAAGADPDAIALLLFTSGTTGAPKAAVLRHRHLSSYVIESVEFMGAAEDEATLVTAPPYHIAGAMALVTSVYAGRRIVMLPEFDPDAWIDLVRAEGVTHAMVVPTMLTRIVDALDARGGDVVTGLRSLSYGGGKMARSVIERALDLFPETEFVNAYGLTETSSTISVLGPEDHRVAHASTDPEIRARLSSVGRPLPSVELMVCDRSGREVPAGVSGEIWVRGEQVSGEYIEHGSVLDGDGWFLTRDDGFIDAHGFLHVTGRSDDVIVRGGENMAPGEIEEVLLSHPAVVDAAAVGIPSRQWGEKVIAVVVAAEPVDPSDLQELVRSRLRSTRVPEHVEFVSELPHNETGKLLRRRLREDFAHLGETVDADEDDRARGR